MTELTLTALALLAILAMNSPHDPWAKMPESANVDDRRDENIYANMVADRFLKYTQRP